MSVSLRFKLCQTPQPKARHIIAVGTSLAQKEHDSCPVGSGKASLALSDTQLFRGALLLQVNPKRSNFWHRPTGHPFFFFARIMLSAGGVSRHDSLVLTSRVDGNPHLLQRRMFNRVAGSMLVDAATTHNHGRTTVSLVGYGVLSGDEDKKAVHVELPFR